MQKVVCHNPYPHAEKCQESRCVLQFIHNIFFHALPQSTFITVPSNYVLILTCLPMMTDVDFLTSQQTFVGLVSS